MSSLNRNIVANFAGNGWTALLSLGFVPVYVHFLGIEAYGLIGFYLSIQALLSLLDLGLGAALTRELARLSVSADNADTMRHLTRTLEIVYCAMAAGIALMVVPLAHFLATSWLKLSQLSVEEAQHALVLMGIATAARWPFALYAGALRGLERQVLLNVLRIALETLRSVGAVLALLLLVPTLEVFFLWQIAASVILSLTFAIAAWVSLPQGRVRARFEIVQLQRVWRFAAGLSGVAITVVILMQADKIILSKLLSLEAFGYYSLAWTVAAGLSQLVAPITSAYLPRLSQAVARGDEATFRELYHRGSKLMSVLVLPAGLTVSLFSYTVLALWTRSSHIAEETHTILAILILGTAMNGLMNIPYASQLAHGWTKLAFVANICGIVVLVPLTYVLAVHWGTVGAAISWPLLNLGYIVISVQVMHKRLLRKEMFRWYTQDVGVPLLAALVPLIVFRAIGAPDEGGRPIAALAYVLFGYAAAVLMAFIATHPRLRATHR